MFQTTNQTCKTCTEIWESQQVLKKCHVSCPKSSVKPHCQGWPGGTVPGTNSESTCGSAQNWMNILGSTNWMFQIGIACWIYAQRNPSRIWVNMGMISHNPNNHSGEIPVRSLKVYPEEWQTDFMTHRKLVVGISTPLKNTNVSWGYYCQYMDK